MGAGPGGPGTGESSFSPFRDPVPAQDDRLSFKIYLCASMFMPLFFLK